MIEAVQRQGMVRSLDVKDYVVAGEIDFDHDVLRSHFLEQILRIRFKHNVHTVADALGMTLLDGAANVTAEALVGNHSRSNFTGMKADVHVGVHGVHEVENLHVDVVIAHGDKTVFGHDEVDADYVGISGSGFEGDEKLGEDLLLGITAQCLE